jgi:hypothetical protein
VPSSTTRPSLRDLTVLDLQWTDFLVMTAPSVDPRLGSLAFADCVACYRVEIELMTVDRQGNITLAGKLRIYLGSEAATNYKTNHDDTVASSLVPLALVTDPGLRVDASGIDPSGTLPGIDPTPCCITFATAASNSKYGKLLVRSVTVVLDHGEAPLTAALNHQVKDVGATVNLNSSNAHLQVVAAYNPSCDWPPIDGLVMQIYKVLDGGERRWSRTVIDAEINQCTLQGSVNVNDFAEGARGPGSYEVVVTAFDNATSPDEPSLGGIPLPFAGAFSLK